MSCTSTKLCNFSANVVYFVNKMGWVGWEVFSTEGTPVGPTENPRRWFFHNSNSHWFRLRRTAEETTASYNKGVREINLSKYWISLIFFGFIIDSNLKSKMTFFHTSKSLFSSLEEVYIALLKSLLMSLDCRVVIRLLLEKYARSLVVDGSMLFHMENWWNLLSRNTFSPLIKIMQK